MERIVYRKTLDVHKNGVQFILQGFETADNLSRVIEISLMASGDAIDFPLEKIEALMYVTTPNATEPSINKCTIKDNKIVYDVLPIVEEGITNMQLKIIETSTDGATSVLASPKFAVEVTKSDTDDSSAEQTTTFTALEEATAKAKTVYDERFLRMELTSDCLFRAYYADGTFYETDVLQRLFLNGNVLLSESFAHGGTGVRAGEDTDNSKYYSNVSKSEALKAESIMENSEDILEEVKLHGVYTAFSVDFESGEVEYVSPSFSFKINLESGELDAIGQTYSFDDEIGRIVDFWLDSHGIVLSNLQDISTTHTEEITELKETTETHTEEITELKETTETHTEEIVKLNAINGLALMVKRDADGAMLTTTKTLLDSEISFAPGKLSVSTATPSVYREEVIASNLLFDLEGAQPELTVDVAIEGERGSSSNTSRTQEIIISDGAEFSKTIPFDISAGSGGKTSESITLTSEEVEYLYHNNPNMNISIKLTVTLTSGDSSGYAEDYSVTRVNITIHPALRYKI